MSAAASTRLSDTAVDVVAAPAPFETVKKRLPIPSVAP